jgi:Spy/CpxP family protein refolding chaperone
MVHHELKLSADQEHALDALEATFANRRASLEAEMRKANAELAAAIRSSDSAGPAVEAAVHHVHTAMGALQTETIEHVFAMRQVLTPEQRNAFDQKIGQALTSGAE